MTLNELAFNVLNKMTGGRSTHNEYISLDQIKFNINYYRSLLIHRDLRRSQNKELFEQEIETQIELSDRSDVDFKTISKIPQIIRLNYEYPLSVVADKRYPVQNRHAFMFSDYNRFTKDETRCYLSNNILYIKGIKDLSNGDNIRLEGIFENPGEAYKFNGEDPLKIDDLEYPVSGDMAQRISESLINGDFQLMLQTPNDITHDTIPPAPKGMGGN